MFSSYVDDGFTIEWIFSVIVLIIILFFLLAYLALSFLKEKKRKKLEKTIGKKAFKEKEEGKKKIKYIDEVLLFLGMGCFGYGYYIGYWPLLIMGTVIMLFSVVFLHYLLVKKHKKGKPKEERKKEDKEHEHKHKEEKKEEKLVAKKEVYKPQTGGLKTDFDSIYDYVMEKGSVRLRELKSKFNISLDLLEEYAKILDSQKMLTFYFPIFGQPILRKKIDPRKKEQVSKKNKIVKLGIFALIITVVIAGAYFLLRHYGYIY